MFQELDKEQLNGLANLCFDLAKGSIALAVLPSFSVQENPLLGFFRIVLGLFWGVVFTWFAMVFLKRKGEMQ